MEQHVVGINEHQFSDTAGTDWKVWSSSSWKLLVSGTGAPAPLDVVGFLAVPDPCERRDWQDLDTTRQVIHLVHRSQAAWMIMADFNMTPQEMEGAAPLHTLRGVCVVPTS